MKFFEPIIALFKRKPKEIKLTKIQIIDYVVDYFQKNPRATQRDGPISRCLYLTKTGLRCGHSICLEDDFVKDTIIARVTNAKHLINNYGDNIHKPEFRGHDSDFWSKIQELHDSGIFWRDNELTDDGREFVRKLKEIYSQ